MASPSPRRSRSRSPGRDSPARSPRRSVSPRSDSRTRSRLRSLTPPSYRRNGRSKSLSRSRSRSRGRESSRSVSRSRSRSRELSFPRSAKIVVEQITKNVNRDHLQEIFSTYGTILDIDLAVSKTFRNQNGGLAYILYKTTEDAQLAISHMQEAQIDGVKITVSIVLPKRRWSRSPPAKYGYVEREGPRGASFGGRGRGGRSDRFRSPERGPRGGGYGGRVGGGPPRGGNSYYPSRDGPARRDRSYTRSRSRSPPRRSGRDYSRSPSYTRSPSPRRGGYGRRDSPPREGRGRGNASGRGGRRRSRSRSYSSRSRSRSYTRSRSRDRGGRRR